MTELEQARFETNSWKAEATRLKADLCNAQREVERLRPRADEWHMLKVENDMMKHRLKQLEPVAK